MLFSTKNIVHCLFLLNQMTSRSIINHIHTTKKKSLFKSSNLFTKVGKIFSVERTMIKILILITILFVPFWFYWSIYDINTGFQFEFTLHAAYFSSCIYFIVYVRIPWTISLPTVSSFEFPIEFLIELSLRNI